MGERPGPYVPLARYFATGRTGTAIQERFGVAGLGIWASMIAAADRGLITFMHDQDWGAIGIRVAPPFGLQEFLTYLGQRKQTRRTRHGQVTDVQLTRWEDWNNTRKREVERLRKSRNRHKSKRDMERDNMRTDAGRLRDPELELEVEEKTVTVTQPRSKTTGPGDGDGDGRVSEEHGGFTLPTHAERPNVEPRDEMEKLEVPW